MTERLSLTQHLDDRDVAYRMHTLEDLESDDAFSLEAAAKSLLFHSDKGYALAVLGLTRRVNSAQFKQTLGVKKLRLATEQELREVMDCAPGDCHPFGSLMGVETTLDTALEGRGAVYFSAGLANAVVELSVADYIRVEHPSVANIS